MMAGGFFVGLHQPSDAKHFPKCCVSVNRLLTRKSDFAVNEWLMDSGAFTELTTHGRYRDEPAVYAERVRRWASCGKLLAAVSQDYMCEPFVLGITGMTIEDHQRLTIERYDSLAAERLPVHLLPVLQGYDPTDYVRHLEQYGERLTEGIWCGVGSVCKRNANVDSVEDVLLAIRGARPDLKLHGFGLKITALESSLVRKCLHSADSMAWSFAARKNGRNANDWREARDFCERIEQQRPREYQQRLFA